MPLLLYGDMNPETLRLAAACVLEFSENEVNLKIAASSAVRRIERMYPDPHA